MRIICEPPVKVHYSRNNDGTYALVMPDVIAEEGDGTLRRVEIFVPRASGTKFDDERGVMELREKPNFLVENTEEGVLWTLTIPGVEGEYGGITE